MRLLINAYSRLLTFEAARLLEAAYVAFHIVQDRHRAGGVLRVLPAPSRAVDLQLHDAPVVRTNDRTRVRLDERALLLQARRSPLDGSKR